MPEPSVTSMPLVSWPWLKADIVAAFPATGKTFLSRKAPWAIADSDSSAFSWAAPGERHPGWPGNYMTHILQEVEAGKTVLVSTHAEVRQALAEEGVPFALVYPSWRLIDVYTQRMARRGSPSRLITTVRENWVNWLVDLERQPCAQRRILGDKEFLADVL